MKSRLLGIAILCFAFLAGCGASAKDAGRKVEVRSYSEKLFKIEQPFMFDLSSDYSNIEVYCWDKNEIKIEMTGKVRGTQKKGMLEEKLKEFKIDIVEASNKISLKSEYKGANKNSLEKSMDFRVYIPKRSRSMSYNVGSGNLKFYDDIKGDLTIVMDHVNIDINRLDGKLTLQGNGGNLRIGSGRILSDSSIKINTGNIAIKAEYEENGKFSFETGAGNIDLGLPVGSKVSAGTMGALEVNDFSNAAYGTKLSAVSKTGKIAVRKY